MIVATNRASQFWLGLGVCYGTLIGHVLATSFTQPANGARFWLPVVGALIGSSLSLVFYLRKPIEAEEIADRISLHRLLVWFFPIVFIIWGFIAPALDASR